MFPSLVAMTVEQPCPRIELIVHQVPLVSARRIVAFYVAGRIVLTSRVPDPVLETIEIGDARLRTATWGAGPPDIVMLHDGLGSITQWRSVPGDVAVRTGLTVMAYERPGHGQSLPTPVGPWPTDWLEQQAALLHQLLEAVHADAPILVGHSDGGSTALIHAVRNPDSQRAVLALAPHSWVEQICFDSIVEMRKNREPIVAGLAKHQGHPDELFEAWSGVWVSDDFRWWDIRPVLSSITVPALIAQGADDPYASDDQAHLTAAAIGANAQSIIVPKVGHIMHHDDADRVVAIIAEFVGQHR